MPRRKSTTASGSKSIAEFRMRKILRELYPFHKPEFNHRPKWLQGCEIDVFYSSLNLGFEFNGKQHYEFDARYHKTEACLSAQIERDRFKLEECRRRGVRLIVVRYAHLCDSSVIQALINGENPAGNPAWRGNPRSEHRRRKERKKASHERRLAKWKTSQGK